MNTAEIAAYLGRFPPFDALSADDLAAVAEAASERTFAAGEIVLVEDGPPAEEMFVIRSGTIELVHQGEAVDVLEPGESFGHPSLLTGLAPTFTVRARDDSVCYVIPREQALVVLGRPEGAGWVAATLRERLIQTGHLVHALPELGTIRVEELISRLPVFAEAGVTIRRAAQTMTDAHASAILVRDGDNLFILTDAILRSRVVSGGLAAENPVSRIVEPAVIVPPDRIAVDAAVEMLDRGADHLVVVDAGRRVLGVLSGTDLAGLETRSPFALRHAILSAADEDALVAVAARLRPLFLALLDANLAPVDVGRVLSLQVDSIVAQLIDFAVARRGEAPAAWAWLALGSVARREFTLGSDVETALAYAASEDPEVDRYFARLAQDVTDGLARCGFLLDPNDVVASNKLWRMSEARWIEVFRECLESPDRSHLIRANVAFDFRQTAGGLDVTPPLVAVLRKAKDHSDLLRRLARTATDFKPPLGFRGSLGSDGIDLKQGGVIPIANLARFLALSNGITISSTTDRLVAVEEAGALDAEAGSALREAFQIVMRIRLDHHADCLQQGREPDNVVDPAALPPLTRAQLREAFRAIAAAQKRLSVYVPLGI
jgi:CBS domain-containing protein